MEISIDYCDVEIECLGNDFFMTIKVTTANEEEQETFVVTFSYDMVGIRKINAFPYIMAYFDSSDRNCRIRIQKDDNHLNLELTDIGWKRIRYMRLLSKEKMSHAEQMAMDQCILKSNLSSISKALNDELKL
jgi:hypothetical protein